MRRSPQLMERALTMIRSLFAVTLATGVTTLSGIAAAASQADWQGDRVRISGTCSSDAVTLSGPFGFWDVLCMSGHYEYLAEAGALAPGDEVLAFIDEVVDN